MTSGRPGVIRRAEWDSRTAIRRWCVSLFYLLDPGTSDNMSFPGYKTGTTVPPLAGYFEGQIKQSV